MRIILASNSPRRKELLNLLTNEFEVIASNTDEILNNSLTLKEQSIDIAYQKAKAVFDRIKGDKIVIGSDTIVVKDNKIYGKPRNKNEAVNMIKSLQNTYHDVMTSLAVLIEKDGKVEKYTDCDITKVYVDKMTEEEINEWIHTGKAMDKAGAYAIQEEFAKYISKIDGNYYSVVGLPINKLYKILKNYI